MTASRQALGLYALKSWYAARLAPLRRTLVARGVTPATLTWTGVAAGALAGVALATLAPGVVAAAVVALALAVRLACANLDGSIARVTGRTTAWGSVVNELGDRLAELAALLGLALVAPSSLVLAACAASTAPSWVSLAGTAAGAPRLQGGPVGKTERVALLVLAAATGLATLVLIALIVGSLLTAALRLRTLHRTLAAGR